ncbi:sperm-associated antigen 17-like isoform X2 [Oculina patagonica]
MSKSRRGKSASANELSRWEAELIQAPLNEETWRSCVFFIAPNKLEDNVFIDVLSEVVASGLRKLFSIITYEGLVKDVKEFGKGPAPGGKGKGAASAKPPQFYEVCEQVKPLVDQGESIPPSLMAKLLKFKLLHVKQKDLDRREDERKAAKAAEAGKKDEKGKKSGRSTSAGKRSKSPGKKKGKKEADLPPSPKKDTKLKRRGDVEDTFKTIDDEPDDQGSPQHYVLIHGILTAPVIYHLNETGVNVDAIICVKAQNYDCLTPTPVQQDENKEVDTSKEDDPEMLDRELQESEERAQKLEAEAKLNMFWCESESIVMRAPSGHKLKDVATYEVKVKESIVPESDLQELDAERKTEFGTAIFEDVADVCYNMLDHLEQYKQYLDSMKLIHVPVHTKPSASASSVIQTTADQLPGSQSVAATQLLDAQANVAVSANIDKRFYDHLIGSVPPESHSVPLILHCLLEQVVATVDDKNPLDQVVPPRGDGLNHDLAAYISSKTSKLASVQNSEQAVTGPADSNKPRKPQDSPVILHYHDKMTSRLHHLEPANGLDPTEAELRMLDLFPQSRLKELPELHGRDMVERDARANELRHFFESQINSDLLERALKQFAFEGMLLKVVGQSGDVVDLKDVDESFKIYSNLWDHPYSKLSEFQALRFPADDSEKVKLASDINSSPLASFRNLDEWFFVEHFDHKTMIQVLEAARLANPYIDTYYHKRDHSLLLALHNPVGANCDSSKSSWSTKLHSNVGFRNYLEHVVSSIEDWVREQERIREQAARTPTPPPPAPEQPSVPLKIGSRYGLMTRQEVALIKAEEEEKGKKKGKKSARGSRSPKRSAKTREKSASPDKKDDKDKKRDGSASSRQKSATGRSPSAKGSPSIKSATSKADKRGRSRSTDFEEPEIPPVEEPVEKPHDFIGYDVGDNLIHVSGSLTTMFPADGGQIQVNKSQYVQGAKRISTSVFKDGNMFVLHFLEPIDEILTKEELEGSVEKEDGRIVTDENKQEDNAGEEVDKSEVESSEKEQHKRPKDPKPFCDFSSFVAELSDGMVLALSGYGPSGSLKEKETKESEDIVTGYLAADVVPPPQATPSPQPKAGSPKARKRAEEEVKRMEEIQQQQEEERLRLEDEARKKAEEERLKKPFQHVYITCPDGQHVQYLNDDSYQSRDNKGGVIVRQSYPVRPLGPAKEKPASEETSRTVMTDGTVIKLLADGSIQVLFPDGAVSKCQSYPIKSPPPTSKPGSAIARQDPSVTAATKKNLRGPGINPKPSEEPLVPAISLPEKVPEWSSTAVDGNRVVTIPDGGHESVAGVLCSLATCPQSGQVLKTREDNVITVECPDGTRIVEHADGTRVTTFYKQIISELQAPDNETGEQAEYCEITKTFFKVECTGFATVIFDSDLGSCETVFGNGTRLDTQANGVSVMYRPDGTQLHIEAKGVVSYYGRDAQTDKQAHDSKTPKGIYVMRTASQDCCEVTDGRGNHFIVMSNGQMTVDKKETESINKETIMRSEGTVDEKEEPSEPGPLQQAPASPIVPRFFIIHADGTGSELLRSADVKDFLERAEEDPATAVLKSPLEGHLDVTGLTILKPYSGGTDKIWWKEKDEKLIIPQGLRERDFKVMPSRELKKPGPVFGTNAGNSLNIGSSVVKPIPPPPITCPRALEFRQLIQYKPLTMEQRQQITKAMQDYGEYLEKRQTGLDDLLPRDPRNESEKVVAEKLQANVRQDTENEAELRDKQDEAKNEDLASKYVNEITPDPVPQPPPPKWKRSSSEWERDRIELAELDYGKHALRYKEVPPYFETTPGQEFLKGIYSQKVPDMEALTSELAHQTRHPPPGESSPAETPEIVVYEGSATSDRTEEEKDPVSPDVALSTTNGETTSLPTGEPSATPNGMRPTNPTPAHATGNGTPTPVRPTNPTPSHASSSVISRPSNPTPRQASELLSHESPLQGDSPQWRNNLESVQEVDVPSSVGEVVEGPVEAEDPDEEENVPMFSADMPQVGPRSLYFDVTGEARSEKVNLPSCIRSSKPGALPNTQFYEVEDPVRRRVQTVSVAGGDQEQVENLRGFELLPAQVSFGVLKEGCTYVHSVLLKNVGIDSCRYKIKQPPPSTGLRVLYQPGPVAAGMNTVLDVEIFAVAVGVVGESGLGHVGHHVEIVTETDILYLPVTATIMTVYEYEARYGDTQEGLAQGTRRVPNRPPSRDPTRPRKEEDYALLDAAL